MTTTTYHRRAPRTVVALLLLVSLFAAACGSDAESSADAGDASASNTATDSSDAGSSDSGSTDAEGTATSEADDSEADDAAADDAAADDADASDCPTVTLATHDSFAVTEGIFDQFEADTCITVEVVAQGDAGQLVSTAILTKDRPTADVLFGIDNTFLQRGLDADLFEAYESAALADVDAALQLDPDHRVTPIDYGDVCVNYWVDSLPGEAPETLDDLLDPSLAGQFVTMNPETSSPGFAFLLATIARYGEDWEDYWQSLVDNGLTTTAGWSDAYYGEFIAGGGQRSIVTSYASSPPAEFIFADPPVDAPPTAVLYDSCFRQIEFAGILAGTENYDAASQLVDFMLSPAFQEDIPLNMFVYPANRTAALPEAFVQFGQLAENPTTLSPSDIEAGRDAWTERWVEIVLG